jgi:hypothetical protein
VADGAELDLYGLHFFVDSQWGSWDGWARQSCNSDADSGFVCITYTCFGEWSFVEWGIKRNWFADVFEVRLSREVSLALASNI